MLIRELVEAFLRWLLSTARMRMDNMRITLDIIEYQLTLLANAPLVN